MFRRALNEPLTHFLALALIILTAYYAVNPADRSPSDRIMITSAKVEQLAAYFSSNWQRAPTPPELKGLVDDYVKEEIYYREALSLGLDKNDPIIRRRLRNKMEFLDQVKAEATIPSRTDLETYLNSNPKKFQIEPAFAFRHVFFHPDKRRGTINADVAASLTELSANPELETASFGDPTLLPPELPMTGKRALAQMYGPDFADSLEQLAPGKWAGPVKSSFGLHIVFVSEQRPSRTPALEEVTDAVAREWRNEKRFAINEARFNALLKRYDVVVETENAKANR